MSPTTNVLGVVKKGLEVEMLIGLAAAGAIGARRHGRAAATKAVALSRNAWTASSVVRLRIDKSEITPGDEEPQQSVEWVPQTESVPQTQAEKTPPTWRQRRADKRSARLHRLVSIATWIDSASFSGAVLDEVNPPTYFKKLEGSRSLTERYNALAVKTGRAMKKKVEGLVAEGNLHLQPKTKRKLIRLARRHKRVQSVLRPEPLPVEHLDASRS
jgi:hypothetical protein